MRRNFAQILKEAKIDIKSEYQKLYGMLYDRSIQVSNTKRISAYDELSDYFLGFYFRGTCLSIEEFNNVNGFHKEISYKMISYNHHSMRGKLQEKKNTILKLAELLEAKRTELAKVDSRFCSDIFYLFNNLNIRHNNVDPSINGKFKQAVADMPPEELEHWYDETYQMCLLAFLRLEQADRKIEFDKLKSVIEST